MAESRSFTLGQKLFLVLGVPLIMLALAEAAIRLVGVEQMLARKSGTIEFEMPTWMMEDVNARLRAARVQLRPTDLDWLNIFEPASGFRVRLKPNLDQVVTNTFSQVKEDQANRYRIKSNSLGFRGPELAEHKEPSVYRIAIFGDSSSFGWGVNEEATYAAVLLTELKKRHPERNLEVGNFAIPGDSSAYGRLIFDHFAPELEADLVILGFGANDAKLVYQSHQAQADRFRERQGLQSVRQILRSSALVRVLETGLARALNATAQASEPHRQVAVPRRNYRENMSYMAQASKSYGVAQVLFLNLCTPGNYARLARNAARNGGYLYFNGQRYLLDRVPTIRRGQIHPELVQRMRQAYGQRLESDPRFYVTSDACHPNELGARLIGEKLAAIISAENLKKARF